MKNESGFKQTRRRHFMSIAGVAAVASLALAGCSANSEETAADQTGDFELYASLGLSGASANFSPALQSGLEAAVELINENGGLNGRTVKLEVENNESVPTTAVSNLQNRLNENSPELIWAGSTSSETLAMLSLTTREKIMALNNGSAGEIGDASIFPYSFSTGFSNEGVAKSLVAKMQEEGHKKVGILTASGAFGEGVAAQYKATFEEAGLEVVAQTYDPTAVEMDGPLARINDQNPDAVVFNDFVHPSYVLKSRLKIGMGDIPFYGDISSAVNDMSSNVNDAETKGVELMAYTIQTDQVDRPGADKLIEALEGEEITAGLYMYALSYDTVLSYANAVEAVGSTDVDQVRAAMEAGEGDSYQLAVTDDVGWTEEQHIGSGEGEDLFTFIPVTPMVNGQYQIDG